MVRKLVMLAAATVFSASTALAQESGTGAGKVEIEPNKEITRLPELVLYDHIGFKGSYARTNLSFHYVGDYWNDRMSCVIVVSGVWRFYRDDYYKGPHWDLGPGYYESFFSEKGPDDVVPSVAQSLVAPAVGTPTS